VPPVSQTMEVRCAESCLIAGNFKVFRTSAGDLSKNKSWSISAHNCKQRQSFFIDTALGAMYNKLMITGVLFVLYR